jgi:cyclic beta-1,2-glucan synthetase
VEKFLVRGADRLVLLFDPPFQHSENHPGYIQGYPPGVRENGGQYTHAALWVAQALARLGDGAGAVKLLQMINPIERARSNDEVARYQGEPYVIAADIYGLPGRMGRCGWTWYTGSAAWFYRVWIEEVFGFKLRGDTLSLDPRLPADWPGFTLTYRYKRTYYEITVRTESRPDDVLEVDGKEERGKTVTLLDDGGRHLVLLRVGTAPSKRLEEEKGSDRTVPSR